MKKKTHRWTPSRTDTDQSGGRGLWACEGRGSCGRGCGGMNGVGGKGDTATADIKRQFTAWKIYTFDENEKKNQRLAKMKILTKKNEWKDAEISNN